MIALRQLEHEPEPLRCLGEPTPHGPSEPAARRRWCCPRRRCTSWRTRRAGHDEARRSGKWRPCHALYAHIAHPTRSTRGVATSHTYPSSDSPSHRTRARGHVGQRGWAEGPGWAPERSIGAEAADGFTDRALAIAKHGHVRRNSALEDAVDRPMQRIGGIHLSGPVQVRQLSTAGRLQGGRGWVGDPNRHQSAGASSAWR